MQQYAGVIEVTSQGPQSYEPVFAAQVSPNAGTSAAVSASSSQLPGTSAKQQSLPRPHAKFSPGTVPATTSATVTPISARQISLPAASGDTRRSLPATAKPAPPVERHWHRHDSHQIGGEAQGISPRGEGTPLIVEEATPPTLIAGALPRATPPVEAEPTARPLPQPSPPADFEPIAGRITAGNRPSLVESHIPPQTTVETPFRAAYEVEQFAWLPVIENLCRDQSAGLAQVVRELATESARGKQVFALTSVQRGEGRTTMTQCLARSAALQGLRTCVVDFDTDKPRLAEQLGVALDAGWESLIESPRPLAELLIESLQDRLSALLLKGVLPPEQWPAQASLCQTWFNQLRREFDVILVDTAPVGLPQEQIPGEVGTGARDQLLAGLEVADGPIDRWIVVRDVSQTSLPELARWQRRMHALHLPLLGILENRAEARLTTAASG
ncbi:MAG: hypothetical protein SFX18_08995 [Pirellulales bacterium]|nr:hypothetical protein [Pirellulales bacterium]